MLTEVEIKNFKRFEHLKLSDLKEITLLTGKNNSGKSTIFQAISLVVNVAKTGKLDWHKNTLGYELNSFEDAVYLKDITRTIEISLTFAINNEEAEKLKEYTDENLKTLTYHIKINKKGFAGDSIIIGKNIIEILKESDSKATVFFVGYDGKRENLPGTMGDISNTYLLNLDVLDKAKTDKRYKLISTAQEIVKDKISKIYILLQERNIQKWKSGVGTDPDEVGLDGKNTVELLHYIYSNNREKYSKIVETLRKFDDEIEEISSPLKRDYTFIDVKTQLMPHFNVASLGSGFAQIIPMIVELYHSQPDSIILIEEPESHIHPGMQRDLMDVFFEIAEEENKQIIFTTHSIDILKHINTQYRGKNFKKGMAVAYNLKKLENKTSVESLDLEEPWDKFNPKLSNLREKGSTG